MPNMASLFGVWDGDRMWWRKDVQMRAGRSFSAFDRSLHIQSVLLSWKCEKLKSIKATQFCHSASADAILHSPYAPSASLSPLKIPPIVARSDIQEAETDGCCE